MFCVSDRLHPTHHRLQQPVAVLIPPAYDQQAVAMMMSVLPAGQTLMKNFQAAPVPPPLPPSSLTLCEFQRGTSPTPSRPRYDGLSPAKLKAAGQQQIRGRSGRDGKADGMTSFRIADILDWRVGSSSRRVHHHASPAMETTALKDIRPSAGSASIVRPWSSSSSVSSSSSSTPSELEERLDDVDDDDDAAEIDVDDASCSLPGTTSSDTTSDRDVCPLGALLRMANQTNFDECANRLQECFTDGRPKVSLQ